MLAHTANLSNLTKGDPVYFLSDNELCSWLYYSGGRDSNFITVNRPGYQAHFLSPSDVYPITEEGLLALTNRLNHETEEARKPMEKWSEAYDNLVHESWKVRKELDTLMEVNVNSCGIEAPVSQSMFVMESSCV